MPIPELSRKNSGTNEYNESETPINHDGLNDTDYKTELSGLDTPIIQPENNNMNRNKRKSKKSFKRSLLKFVGILTLLGTVLFFALVSVITRDLPDITKLNEALIAESTIIYDRTGEHILFQFFW